MRDYLQASDPSLRIPTVEEHRRSIKAMLETRTESGDVWLFAYGSLIWNPLIHWVAKRVGTARGYHRCFCLWSPMGRGTTAKPALTLGLEPGGACRGVAFRIAEAEAASELEIIWRREMLTGAYVPRWVKVGTADGPIEAVTFLVNRGHKRYAGRLPEETIIAAIAEAEGPLGACATYLFNTVTHLEALGIRDPRMIRLRDRVSERIERAAAAD